MTDRVRVLESAHSAAWLLPSPNEQHRQIQREPSWQPCAQLHPLWRRPCQSELLSMAARTMVMVETVTLYSGTT